MDKSVTVRILRSDNKEFVMDGTEWRIPSDGLEGFGSFSNSIVTVDNAVGDGGIISSDRVGPKDRTIKAKSVNRHMNDVLRMEANSFFNVKMTFKVYVTYMGITRWAEGEIAKYDLTTGNVYKSLNLMVTFLFPNPYLKSYEDFGKDIASITGMIAFPYMCAVQSAQNVPTGITGGIYNFARQVVLDNDGDVETYCRAVFLAKGIVKNPELIIGDKFVRVLDEMDSGDVIEIDFVKNPPTVKKNGVNIIGKCDRKSDFNNMILQKGDTEIQFDADDGTNLLAVSIYYNKLYQTI